MLRVAPHGTTADNDVPAWYREMTGPESALHLPAKKWRVDPEDPRYVAHFGGFIRALGKRYDGHPSLESVDLSILAAWGEGEHTDLLSQKTREALVDSYLEAFPRTLLVMLLTDPKTNGYGLSRRPVGWRVDCLGDMGGFSPGWCHMQDLYPQLILQTGMQDAWKKAPVSLEVCWVMQVWKDKGWNLDYIIDQSLKWHMSSINAKSSAVPAEWKPQVERWLKKMGYRLALRKFTWPAKLRASGKLSFTSWWENQGVAPCYHAFPLVLRLKSGDRTAALATHADIRQWLPGDSVYDDTVSLPADLPPGDYELAVGIVDPVTRQPNVRLAIAGRDAAGWYPLGKLRIE
jgi:hypothetical protein